MSTYNAGAGCDKNLEQLCNTIELKPEDVVLVHGTTTYANDEARISAVFPEGAPGKSFPEKGLLTIEVDTSKPLEPITINVSKPNTLFRLPVVNI
jgi:hypothetical protein